MKTVANWIFVCALSANFFLLIMVFLSQTKDNFQYWPPPNRNTWQYLTLWWTIRIIFISIAILSYIEWSTINLPEWLRFYVAVPICLIAIGLGTKAFIELGWKNTHGEADKFINNGLYKYSRNPQYVFYVVGFISLAIIVASLKVLILLLLAGVWYMIAPFPEEKWLEKQYGAAYLEYKQRVPRYFGRISH